MAGKGILLDESGDLTIINNSLDIGNTLLQEVSIILQMNQGHSRFDPLLGANLINLVKTNKSRFEIEKRVKTHLAIDNKNYDEIKDLITTHVIK